MKTDITTICIMVDNCNGDEGLLKEIYDFVKANRSLYKDYQAKFIFEHINEALNEGKNKTCETAKHIQ